MSEREKKRAKGITLEIAQDHLDQWLEAELELTTHQSYRIGNHSLTLADLDMVGKRIAYWSDMVEKLKAREKSGGRNRVYHIVPRDY